MHHTLQYKCTFTSASVQQKGSNMHRFPMFTEHIRFLEKTALKLFTKLFSKEFSSLLHEMFTNVWTDKTNISFMN